MRNELFLKTLKKGDLVLASNYGSQKQHLVRLTYCKTEVKHEEKEKDKDDLQLWSGDPYCNLSGRYYYRPVPGSELSDEEWRCRVCWSRWKGLGSPGVKGWTIPVDEALPSEWPLPFGWHEVSVAGHPWDVPEGGDVTKIVNKEGDVVGKLRTERRRWQRGPCIVRIVQRHGEETWWETRYHDQERPLSERAEAKGTQADCVLAAWKLMAKGGRP